MTHPSQLPDDELAVLAWQATQGLPDAPPALLRAAIGLFAQRAPSLGERLQRVITAVLRFDSAATPAVAMGMRGGDGDSRHLLFSAEGRDVDLRITPQAGGQWLLAGQVLGPDDSGQVVLAPADGGDARHQVALDEMGEFRLPDVAAGRWALRLALGDDLVELPTLSVG